MNQLRIFSIQLNSIWESDRELKRVKLTRRDYLLRECGVVPPVKTEEEALDGYGNDDIIVTGDQLLSMISRQIEFKMKHEADYRAYAHLLSRCNP